MIDAIAPGNFMRAFFPFTDRAAASKSDDNNRLRIQDSSCINYLDEIFFTRKQLPLQIATTRAGDDKTQVTWI